MHINQYSKQGYRIASHSVPMPI